MKKIEAKIGLKVHPLGREDKVLFIIKLGGCTARVHSNKNSKSYTSFRYDELVKFKNQD